MTKLPRMNTIGAPGAGPHHHRMRRAASLVAAAAGATAALITGFLVIGTVTPIEGAGIYGVVLLLLAVFLTGIWWRWDSPDVRDPNNERERRGF
ncbi:MAG: hypothetical protein QOJ57_386 [Thermoleophilaceae bacterium]|jgi:hypothetical protein|nr:hypothetical protein [Thermoleophilaceae bacterium]